MVVDVNQSNCCGAHLGPVDLEQMHLQLSMSQKLSLMWAGRLIMISDKISVIAEVTRDVEALIANLRSANRTTMTLALIPWPLRGTVVSELAAGPQGHFAYHEMIFWHALCLSE